MYCVLYVAVHVRRSDTRVSSVYTLSIVRGNLKLVSILKLQLTKLPIVAPLPGTQHAVRHVVHYR